MLKIRSYITDTITELTENVTWPSRKELISSAVVVTVSSLIFAVLIFGMDFLVGVQTKGGFWKGLLGFIYGA